jgi:hypothetical protein
LCVENPSIGGLISHIDSRGMLWRAGVANGAGEAGV